YRYAGHNSQKQFPLTVSAIGRMTLRREHHSMTEQLDSVVRRVRNARAFLKLLGEAPSFLKGMRIVSAIARHDGAALITGETGTGKELVARAIHYASDRAAHPFVCVNCASLPESLAEDSLFGHEVGAFTDARLARRGLFAEADRGTLFL